MIDSHCHLADHMFAHDLDAVLLRAEEHGIEAMVTIADTLTEAEECIRIAEQHSHIFAAVGVHPHHAKDWDAGDAERLQRLINSSSKVKAVGEIGLDYHYDHSPRDVQQEVFRVQLHLAKELRMPAVVHCRKAIADVRDIIAQVQPQALVIHCCTERWEDVAPLVERGYMLGFTGIATYSRSEDIRACIRACPLERMMIETDAPYLAPQSRRGQRNEPAFVLDVAELIAETKGISLAEVDAQTTRNTLEFYRLV